MSCTHYYVYLQLLLHLRNSYLREVVYTDHDTECTPRKYCLSLATHFG